LIPELKPDDIVVLELSNFQLADLHKSPYVSVITNLGVDHLDYHKDIEEYHKAKESILKYQSDDNWAVLNLESTYGDDYLSEIKSQICYFSGADKEIAKAVVREVGGKAGVFLKRGDSREEAVCFEDEIKLVGRHNLENIAAASIVADIFGAENTTISESVKNFIGLPYRLEFVAEIGGAKYINDSFATNPGPTMAAIKSFKNDKILILGGSRKGADFSEMTALISKSKVKAVLLIGLEGENIKNSLMDAGFSGKIFENFTDLDQVAMKALEIADANQVVIFSPACASFDMFKNYKDRGEKFKNAVLELQSKVESQKSKAAKDII
jgi:UDP-N-acetylmuramoylalanine--D-glutamate ligase